MYQKVLTSFLAILLVAPLNASAAAWMAMSMGNSEQHVQHMTISDSDLGSQSSAGHTETSAHPKFVTTHDHDASDCEEHCASCTNHCSSLGIVTSFLSLLDLELLKAGLLSGSTISRFEILLRPPILA